MKKIRYIRSILINVVLSLVVFVVPTNSGIEILPAALANVVNITSPNDVTSSDGFFADGFEAEFVSQTITANGITLENDHPIVLNGETVEVTAEFINRGNFIWYKGVVKGATFKPQDSHIQSCPVGYGYHDSDVNSVKQNTDYKCGYDNPDAHYFGSSYLHNYVISKNTNPIPIFVDLEEDYVDIGQKGTFKFVFQVREDMLPGKYREDISIAAGKYWMKNNINGDSNNVAHIWYGVDVLNSNYKTCLKDTNSSHDICIAAVPVQEVNGYSYHAYIIIQTKYPELFQQYLGNARAYNNQLNFFNTDLRFVSQEYTDLRPDLGKYFSITEFNNGSYQNEDIIWEITIGAGPECGENGSLSNSPGNTDCSIEGTYGNLIGIPNAPGDTRNIRPDLTRIPFGSEAEKVAAIQTLLQAESNYFNNIPYAPIPSYPRTNANSNSYVSGILNTACIREGNEPNAVVVGWNQPIFSSDCNTLSSLDVRSAIKSNSDSDYIENTILSTIDLNNFRAYLQSSDINIQTSGEFTQAFVSAHSSINTSDTLSFILGNNYKAGEYVNISLIIETDEGNSIENLRFIPQNLLEVSLKGSHTFKNELEVEDEDIISLDYSIDSSEINTLMHIDGANVFNLFDSGEEIDAFTYMPDGSLLFVADTNDNNQTSIPGLQNLDKNDIIRYKNGTFSKFIDGDSLHMYGDNPLQGEEINALAYLNNPPYLDVPCLLFSTDSGYSMNVSPTQDISIKAADIMCIQTDDPTSDQLIIHSDSSRFGLTHDISGLSVLDNGMTIYATFLDNSIYKISLTQTRAQTNGSYKKVFDASEIDSEFETLAFSGLHINDYLPESPIPLINAGEDFQVVSLEQVSITAQVDDNDTPIESLMFEWSVVSSELDITLENPTSQSVSFLAPEVLTESQALTLQVTVNDGVHSTTDAITVTVFPQPLVVRELNETFETDNSLLNWNIPSDNSYTVSVQNNDLVVQTNNTNESTLLVTSPLIDVNSGERFYFEVPITYQNSDRTYLYINLFDSEQNQISTATLDYSGYNTTNTWEKSINGNYTIPNGTEFVTLSLGFLDKYRTSSSYPDSEVKVDTIFFSKNQKPRVNSIIQDQTITGEGKAVTLTASAQDPDNQELLYSWKQLSGTPGTFSSTNKPSVTFTTGEINEDELVSIQLIVSDGIHSSSPKEVSFEVRNIIHEIDEDFSTNNHGWALHQNQSDSYELVFENSKMKVKQLDANVPDTYGYIRSEFIHIQDGLYYVDSIMQSTNTNLYMYVKLFDQNFTHTRTICTLTKGSNETNFYYNECNKNGIDPNRYSNDMYMQVEFRVQEISNATEVAQIDVITLSQNARPKADAGESQIAFSGEIAQLDGSNSFDVNNDPISFSWTQLTGTEIALSDNTSANPTFIVPEVTQVETAQFALTVNDGSFASTSSITEVIFANPTEFISEIDESFNSENALTNWISNEVENFNVSINDSALHFSTTNYGGEFKKLYSKYIIVEPGDRLYINAQSKFENTNYNYARLELLNDQLELITSTVLDRTGYGTNLNWNEDINTSYNIPAHVSYVRLILEASPRRSSSTSHPNANVYIDNVILSKNQRPRINSILQDKTKIAEGDVVTLTANATDGDSNDVLSYSWKQLTGTPGVFNSKVGQVVEFISPEIPNNENIILQLIASDGKNESIAKTAFIEVQNVAKGVNKSFDSIEDDLVMYDFTNGKVFESEVQDGVFKISQSKYEGNYAYLRSDLVKAKNDIFYFSADIRIENTRNTSVYVYGYENNFNTKRTLRSFSLGYNQDWTNLTYEFNPLQSYPNIEYVQVEVRAGYRYQSSLDNVIQLDNLTLKTNIDPFFNEISDQIVIEANPFATINLQELATDEDGDLLTFTVEENTDLLFEIDENNMLEVTVPDENWVGLETFIISVSDGPAIVSQEVIFEVLNENDAPTIPQIKSIVQNESELLINWSESIDVDNDSVSYSIYMSESESPFTAISSNVSELSTSILFTPGIMYEFYVEATDGSLSSDASTSWVIRIGE